MAKKKTLAEKIQKEMDKLEALHEKEEAIMERIRDLVEDDDSDDLFDKDLERNSSLSGQYMSEWFTKKKDPPFKPGKTVGETFKNIAETYYDYGYITPKVVDFFKNKKKKKKKVE